MGHNLLGRQDPITRRCVGLPCQGHIIVEGGGDTTGGVDTVLGPASADDQMSDAFRGEFPMQRGLIKGVRRPLVNHKSYSWGARAGWIWKSSEPTSPTPISWRKITVAPAARARTSKSCRWAKSWSACSTV